MDGGGLPLGMVWMRKVEVVPVAEEGDGAAGEGTAILPKKPSSLVDGGCRGSRQQPAMIVEVSIEG